MTQDQTTPISAINSALDSAPNSAPDSAVESSSEDNRMRAKALVASMSLREKVRLMAGSAKNFISLPYHAVVLKHYNRDPYPSGGNRRLGVPPILFCDGPRGLTSHHATCFPVSMARGASFDPALEARVGDVIAREVRAVGGNYYGGVCINLLRHPAWGRAQETYGEDPVLLARMGVALTEAVQQHGVMACAKHFALNSMENARFEVDVTCSERTLREVYLPHFKACVDAGIASIMSAYNRFRGEYCGHNDELLNRILKQEWGFEGFVLSDFVWGLRDPVAGANGGLDVEMPWPRFFNRKLVRAVKSGSVAESVVDEAATRIVSTVLRFTGAPDRERYSEGCLASEPHTELALEVAEKSMTLLKNEGALLPLDEGSITSLAVIGRLADADNLGDHGSSQVRPPWVVRPLQGLRDYVGPGVRVDYHDGKDAAEAAGVAARADVAIVIVGNNHSTEGEYIVNSKRAPGGDRDRLGLREADVATVRAVAAANPRTACVLIGGSAITMEEWRGEVAAVLYAFYPGMQGGLALARTLFGANNPGGKLPFTIPRDPDHLPHFDKNARAVEYDYYHGYALLDKEGITAAFPFGFGLSYTRFESRDARFEVAGDRVVASLEISNVGELEGDEVVQFYVGFGASSIDRPVKLLRDFQRVRLAPGERTRVTLGCSASELRWYDEEQRGWRLEAIEYEGYIGTSSRNEDLLPGRFSFE